MTTAEALEKLNDAGKFEILATRVLRLIDPDSAAIEHIGVNAAGKTVKNPIDGFCRVPGSSSPHYIMHQFSMTARHKLKRKWLFEPAAKPEPKGKQSEEGDLPKAARMAAEIRREISSASFVLWLCTNQLVDAALIAEVDAFAFKVGIEVRLLGQSRLRDTLDGTPAGEDRGQNLGSSRLPRLRRVGEGGPHQPGDRPHPAVAGASGEVARRSFVFWSLNFGWSARRSGRCPVMLPIRRKWCAPGWGVTRRGARASPFAPPARAGVGRGGGLVRPYASVTR